MVSLNSEMNVNNENSEEAQEARSFLRERFLRSMTAFTGSKCEFLMHERTAVEGTFKGCDFNGDHFLVTDLQTPLGVVPQTLLRSNDIISFIVKDLEVEKE